MVVSEGPWFGVMVACLGCGGRWHDGEPVPRLNATERRRLHKHWEQALTREARGRAMAELLSELESEPWDDAHTSS